MMRRPPSSTPFPNPPLSESYEARQQRAGSQPREVAAPRGRHRADPAELDPNRGKVGEAGQRIRRSEEHTSELQSRQYLVCRLLLEKKKAERTSVATEADHIE